ncbi:MAG: hypothetical protein ACTHJW_06170, partial [Streptosporangiaceae bacterium]
MRLQLCGVRGSTPAPGPEFVRYGGNTSCVALSGDEDSEALVTAVETALEHSMSVQLMRGAAKPTITKVPAGSAVVRQ